MGQTADKTTPMKKNSLRPHLDGAYCRSRRPAFFGWLGVIFLCSLLGISACGELRPHPVAFDPQAYTPIAYRDLLAPGPAGLQAGQQVRVQAYFWQYLEYDPAIAPNYLTLFRYPVKWYQLKWFAIYDKADLTGYYDCLLYTSPSPR